MRWLTDKVATGAYLEVVQLNQSSDNLYILDVRNLVDKSGNKSAEIKFKIDEGLDALKNNHKVVVCCDYGMSRSNSIAIAIISVFQSIPFPEVVEMVRSKIDESCLKVEMLNSTFESLLLSNDRVISNEKRIWITGANGFIGQKLYPLLGINNKVFSTSSKDINLLHDTLKADLFIKANDITHIIHLANPKIYTSNFALGETLTMLKNVLDLCRTNNLNLFYLSGWEIYSGYNSNEIVANEFTPALPKGTYGETKWLSELLISKYVENYNLTCTILRSSPVFGLGAERPKFLYNFIAKALSNETIWTHKYINGNPSLDLVTVSDLSDGIKLLIDKGQVGEFNIGTSLLTSTYDIAQIICNLTNSKSKIAFTEIDDSVACVSMDYSKLKNAVGWTPSSDLVEIINEIIKSFRKNE